MTPDIRLLKTVAVELGGPPVFRRSGCSLSDFLENVVAEHDDAATLAAKCVGYFCLERGSFNGFMPGISLAVGFLAKRFGAFSDAQQRKRAYLDLKQIIDTDCTIETLRQWAQSHFR